MLAAAQFKPTRDVESVIPFGVGGGADLARTIVKIAAEAKDVPTTIVAANRPGEGTIDFARTFRRIEGAGFRGYYMNAFGSLDDMLKSREVLAELARRV